MTSFQSTPRLWQWAALALLASRLLLQAAEPPKTRAEASGYAATSSMADVDEFIGALKSTAPHVVAREFGTSAGGRPLRLLVISDVEGKEPKPDAKPSILCVGNIHGGEVCGKEALLMIARDLPRGSRILKDYTLLFAPALNPDGNERLGSNAERRPNQNGPDPIGARENGDGLDLNRDFTKLDSPEARALVALMREWNPVMVIDLHTTNGSKHGFALTYDSARHPAGDAALVDFTREEFLPEVGAAMERVAGFKSGFYGNFNADKTRWTTYPAQVRHLGHYAGLRGSVSILSEAYSHAPFKERVLATKAFVEACLEGAANQKARIVELVKNARAGVRSGTESVPLKVSLDHRGGKIAIPLPPENAGDKPGSAACDDWSASKIDRSIPLPHAYLLPARETNAIRLLQRHGVVVGELVEETRANAEAHEILSAKRAEQPYQQRHMVALETELVSETLDLRPGSFIIRTSQPLGKLAALLLEPGSEDGLGAWGLMGGEWNAGADFPAKRIPAETSLLTLPLPEPPDKVAARKPILFDTLHGDSPANFGGTSSGVRGWSADGVSLLQDREGKLWRVNPWTGAGTLFFDRAKLEKSLRALSWLGEEKIQQLAGRQNWAMNPQETAGWFEEGKDIYHLPFDGSPALRLTRTPEGEELAEFSPDGKFLAYTRGNNLWVADVATGTERALTADGGGNILNGKADWVYFEELYGRSWKAFWWSPDSRQIAFHRFDNSRLPLFHAVNTLATHSGLESMRHPKVGDPNPSIRLGVASVAGGDVSWVNLEEKYPADTFLVSHVGWMPDSQSLYYHAQDRVQTWLEFNVWTRGGKHETLYRDKTAAWIESPGKPVFLPDGDFLTLSDRDGWAHLYRFTRKTKTWSRVTAGEWEVRRLHGVDRERGLVYFDATKDSHIAENLYRCRLDGTQLERLTLENGGHSVAISKDFNLFVDHWSDFDSPTRAAVKRMDGSLARLLHSNPVRDLERHELGELAHFQIPGADGFPLEATTVKPPGFDPGKKYPVWIMTYGGPHAPSVRNAWQNARAQERMLAAMGLVVLRFDPRTASGKGSVSAWGAYKQLGVRELKDLEEVVRWLGGQAWANTNRVGLSGHSYGGYLTAYALTRSKLFHAGISGAPVTDWRFYDSIYTERFMDLPQNNAEGYKKSSVIEAAGNLSGRLLLLHGMMDDNVHLQNASRLIDALHKADKPFELMVYPEMLHGLHGRHYQRLMADFIRKTMLE